MFGIVTHLVVKRFLWRTGQVRCSGGRLVCRGGPASRRPERVARTYLRSENLNGFRPCLHLIRRAGRSGSTAGRMPAATRQRGGRFYGQVPAALLIGRREHVLIFPGVKIAARLRVNFDMAVGKAISFFPGAIKRLPGLFFPEDNHCIGMGDVGG